MCHNQHRVFFFQCAPYHVYDLTPAYLPPVFASTFKVPCPDSRRSHHACSSGHALPEVLEGPQRLLPAYHFGKLVGGGVQKRLRDVHGRSAVQLPCLHNFGGELHVKWRERNLRSYSFLPAYLDTTAVASF